MLWSSGRARSCCLFLKGRLECAAVKQRGTDPRWPVFVCMMEHAMYVLKLVLALLGCFMCLIYMLWSSINRNPQLSFVFLCKAYT